jgi:hypothetical protein
MAQILTGAKAKVKIGGTVVGFAGGVNVNQENSLSDVDILGQLEVGDLAETGHKCNFSINYFKSVAEADGTGQEVQTANLLGLNNSEDEGLSSMRNTVYFDVEIVDDSNDELVIYKMVDCKFEGGSGQVDARGIWQGTWNFRARKGFGL